MSAAKKKVTKEKQKSFVQLRDVVAQAATKLLELDGGYDCLSSYCSLDEKETEALRAIVRAYANVEDMLGKLQVKIEAGLKKLDQDDFEGIFKRKSVLALFRWVEHEFTEASELFDMIEHKNDARCDIDDFLGHIISELN